MKIIIPGGSGMIGTLATTMFARQGHTVIILSRTPEASLNRLVQQAGYLANVVVRGWDTATAEGWGELVDSDTAIINLVGVNLGGKRWTPAQKKLILESRTKAGQAIVQAAEQARAKPAVVLQVSGSGYYGARQDELISESSPAGSDFPAEVCQAWETSTAALEALGVRRVVMRTGVVLSERGGALPRLLLPFRLMIGGPLGNGRQWLAWIHELDQIAAFQYFIENRSCHGVYNVT
ncbi:MAG TPA: NAD-dependent epimerase/dehydratase family protein, partial [Anaerolineales bacterium]|nr:NAD-dependent epimerase/dehydratase family protein [Anaerolineales bacterium]